jgi:tetratricopeptide (TPR) repeat protein
MALSPDGRYLLVTLATGVVSLFELESAPAGITPRRSTGALELAREAAGAGDLARALEQAEAHLGQEPAESDAAANFAAWRQELVRQHRNRAGELAAAGDFAGALECAEAAFRLDPWNAELFAERLRYRNQARDTALARSGKAEAAGHWEEAGGALEQALQLDPYCSPAREALARVRTARAAALQQEGDERSVRGELLAAIELWRLAETLAPSQALSERLRSAEVQRCLTRGKAFYEAGRMPEAAFQLRKVLALEPGHEEAQRYLGYAQGAAADNQISDRFSRLE